MAVTAGEVLSFHDGSEFKVVRSAADTGGEVLEMEMLFPPTTEDVPRHIHPEPAGTVHSFRIVGDRPARVRNLHAPALDFEDYFATESRLMREGKIKSYSSPVALLYYAGLLRQYRHCMVMASPALRAVIAALSPIGRMLLARGR